MADNILQALRTTGIHQIAELPADQWKAIKAAARMGSVVKVEDFTFPRLTYRYFAAAF